MVVFPFSHFFRKIHKKTSERGAVNATVLRAADFVNERKFKRAVRIRGRAEARRIEVVAESEREIFVIKTGGKDERVHQIAFFELVRNARPDARLERLVAAAVVAEQEFD